MTENDVMGDTGRLALWVLAHAAEPPLSTEEIAWRIADMTPAEREYAIQQAKEREKPISPSH